MSRKYSFPLIIILIFTTFMNACSFDLAPKPTETSTPTNTPVPTSTITSTPTKSPRPTWTPNLAATQQFETWYEEINQYFEKGYLSTKDGKVKKLKDFSEEWAQLDWYRTWYIGEIASDFVYSAHYKWSNASKTPNPSGCGVVFDIQKDGSDYSVFLDQSQIIFLRSEGNTGYYVGKSRGTGKVNLINATEADFTLIVNGYYSYVLVNGEVIGEYAFPQNKSMEGEMGISILSGTNKDYGTRCEITNSHLWEPSE